MLRVKSHYIHFHSLNLQPCLTCAIKLQMQLPPVITGVLKSTKTEIMNIATLIQYLSLSIFPWPKVQAFSTHDKLLALYK